MAAAALSGQQIEPHLGLWPLARGSATLINHSENHTFRVDPPTGERSLVRVHRPGYQTRAAIESELAWIAALRSSTDLLLPEPVAGRDGKLVQALPIVGDEPRLAVAFRYCEGAQPDPRADLAELFRYLGETAAVCHRHAANWRPPPGFERPRWDAGTILSPGEWGDWRQAPGVDAAAAEFLARGESALRQALSAYGQGPDRFGLIHADMRLANVIEHRRRRRLIDFDDCGFGWFMYDFGAAVSFMETNAELPAWRAAWLEGYRRVRPLPAPDTAILDAMVLLRRFALLAWVGSHAETSLARSQAPHFAAGTADLVARFLSAADARRASA